MRNHLRWLFLFLMGVALIGCQDDLNVNSPVNNQSGSSFGLNKISPAIETLTKDLDLTGSKIILAGVGTYVDGTGSFSVNVPAGTIKNVFLYWEGRDRVDGVFPNGDSKITVNGVSIDGELIGKANQEGTNRGFVFRADITSQGFITNGLNNLTVTDFVGVATANDRADGVGIMVVIDDGTKSALEVRDGADWAYLKSDVTYPWLLVTEAQTFTFQAYPIERKADLSLFVGDIGVVNNIARPHHMEITVGDGPVESINKPFFNNSGPQWDTYVKELTIPAGVTKVKVQLFSDPDESVDLAAASMIWFLTTLKVPTPLAKLGDFVWEDVNKNGIQDDGEKGIPNVTVELYDCASTPNLLKTTTTDASGYYFFDGLAAGNYKVKFTTPSGYTPTLPNVDGDTKDSDRETDGFTTCIDLSAGEEDLTWDAGFYTNPLPARIGNWVWEDLDKDGVQDGDEQANTVTGVPGVKVELYTCDDIKVAEMFTNSQGFYDFPNLVPGDYKVKFYLPDGYTFTLKDAAATDDAHDSDADLTTGFTICTTLDPGEHDKTWDAGLVKKTVPLNKLGDFVWHDKDVDGIQDANEPGIKDVVVELLSGNVVIKTTTTDENGKYLFTDLANGNYCVRVAASNYEVGGVLYSTAQTKWYSTKKNQGSDDAKDSDANKNESICTDLNNNDDLTLDFGFYKTCVSVTKLANKTTAKPGETITYTFVVENCGDITLGGGVDLFDPMLNPTSPYKIANITPVYPGTTKTITKTYCVTTKDCGDLVNVVKAVGHPVDGSANVEFTASVTVKIDCPPAPAKLGDKVWFDKDNDGIQDSDESGIKDIKVELLDCSGKLVATTYTNYYGLYYFTNVTPGDYKVKFYAPTGYGFTKKDQGTNDAKDSDADQSTGISTCLTLTSGQTDLTWDAGLICLPKSKLGDKVWLDKDKDGIQDSGEPGVKDVKVRLYNCSGTLLATTYTNYYGNYSFSNLNAGEYQVKFYLPTGYAFTKKDQGSNDEKDSDANLETGLTTCITLGAGVTDLKWDAGLVQKSSCFSPDYWKKHTKYFPSNPYDLTWKQCGSKGEDTDFFKCGTSWYKVLCSTDSDAYYKLSHQLIAAKLNMLWGAHTSGDCKNAIRDAEDLLNKYTPSYIKSLSSSHSLKVKFSNLASFLGKCNND